MRIAITTPTGHIGSALVDLLRQTDAQELVLVARDPKKLERVLGPGVTSHQADLEDRVAFSAAVKGADALFLLIPPKFDAPDFRGYQREVIANAVHAIEANNIKTVVLLSSVGAQHADGTGPVAGLHDAEEALKGLVDHLTILRPASFMENYLMQAGAIGGQGAIYNPAPPEAPQYLIATRDIAAAAARALLGAAPEGTKVVELAYPHPYTHARAAEIIGEAIGKPVQYTQVPSEAINQALLGMGASPSVANAFVEMFDAAADGRMNFTVPMEEVVATPTSFEEFTEHVLAPVLATA